ncbi:hypothetical protein EHRUM1_08950 [Ehrlichia ruminantium]|nr:hypothetical protein EHRUM1_08950 [Ehrlichia ruminantium]
MHNKKITLIIYYKNHIQGNIIPDYYIFFEDSKLDSNIQLKTVNTTLQQ